MKKNLNKIGCGLSPASITSPHAHFRQFWRRTLAILCTLVVLSISACSKNDEGEFRKLMNQGKAHLENRSAKESVAAFEAAVALDGTSPPALRNLARAYMLAQRPKDAVATLLKARKLESDSAATSYLLGLAYAASSQYHDAVSAFEDAVRLDGNLATLRFQLAGAYEATEHYDKALQQLRETVRLDPFHASAHYKLATRARRDGDMEEYQKQFEEFQRLKNLFGDEANNRDALMQCAYTEPEAAPSEPAQPTPPKPMEVRFQDGTEKAFASDADRAASAACIIDVDDQGRSRVFAVSSGGAAILEMEPSGRFRRSAVEWSPPDSANFTQCVAGDFQDVVPEGTDFDAAKHALNDVLLIAQDGIRLLRRQGPLAFSDVTQSAGLAGVSANNARWADVEHDGDLDLLLARREGLALWQNNGNGTFQEETADVGLTGAVDATGVAPLELDENNAIDIAVIHGDKQTRIFINQRAGKFAPMTEPPGPWPAAHHILCDDFNNDGHVDIALFGNQEAIILAGQSTQRWKLPLSDVDIRAVAAFDVDNDGRLDLCAAGANRADSTKGAIRIWQNRPSASEAGVEWADITDPLGVKAMPLPPIDDLVTADLDGDGDTDLLLKTTDDHLRFLRNDGGHRNGQLKIKLLTVKTNPSGLGTHIELREGNFWVSRNVSGLPIEIGLGGRQRLDSIQTVWTNGVVDNQIDVAVGFAPMTIKEKVVATGSCPYLYAWDGRQFRFVTDILGNAPIGLLLRRDLELPADPDELVEIGDAETFVPRDNAYTLAVTEETREVAYLDSARLVAVDHPADWEIHPTDKLMPPPFPKSALWALGNKRTPIRSVDSNGADRTEVLSRIDGAFAPPGHPLPPPYRGLCHPTTLTMDFGPIDSSRALVLALTGWLQYGDASRNIAASQNDTINPIWPALEVETSPDSWHPIDVMVGMPAGKTKTILCDLTGKLPTEARRLRLTTSFEIRWDRIALFDRMELPSASLTELTPASAQLSYRGFSEIRARQPGHPTTPDFDNVRDTPPWRTTPQGWCTRYGEVLPLVNKRDGALAIVNAGDAFTLRFAAGGLPPVPSGMKRTFFFYSIGWEKDEDHNVVTGDTVEPLPAQGDSPDAALTAELHDWRLEYNTRWVAHRFTVPKP